MPFENPPAAESKPRYDGDIMARHAELVKLEQANNANADEKEELRRTRLWLDAERRGTTRALRPWFMKELNDLKKKNERQKNGQTTNHRQRV